MTPPAVFLITDPRVPLAKTVDVVADAARAIGGLLGVQLRDKGGPSREAARALRAVTREAGAMFLVNGSVSLAREVGADGVHFPSGAWSVVEAREALGAGAFITTAAHDDDDVRRAIEARVSGVLVSPIYETPGPGKAPPRGEAALTRARALADAAPPDMPRVRVYALGGVNEDRVAACAKAGADGVAVIRALFDAKDAARVARRLAAGLAGSGTA